MVPACRTLDCVSVFALTVDDAMTALQAMAGPDAADPYSRDRPLGAMRHFRTSSRLGVPRNGQRIFFGDRAAETAYDDALQRWTALGATLVEIDIEPFYETARLLYEGPWVAERYLVIRDLLASSPDAIHPVTREITATGARLTAADTFAALYRLQALRRVAERMFAQHRCAWCCRPRRPPIPSSRCWPIRSSSTAGSAPTPTSSICSISAASRCRLRCATTACRSASRCWRRRDTTRMLAGIGRAFHADTKLPIGRQGPGAAAARAAAGGDKRRRDRASPSSARISPAWRSTANCRRSARACSKRPTTAPDYRLYALGHHAAETGHAARRAGHGQRDRARVWALSAAAFGKFVAAIPSPLSIGTVRLADGRGVKGFVVEPMAIDRRARYFELRRLARIHGGEDGLAVIAAKRSSIHTLGRMDCSSLRSSQ